MADFKDFPIFTDKSDPVHALKDLVVGLAGSVSSLQHVVADQQVLIEQQQRISRQLIERIKALEAVPKSQNSA